MTHTKVIEFEQLHSSIVWKI